MISASEALERLREGNRRFVEGRQQERSDLSPVSASAKERLHALLQEQRPIAIILGCSDSRVPAEIVFDQGLGDLFVIRVAGNIVAPSLLGSVEFAADRFGTRLVVVLGHTGCGAIMATIDAIKNNAEVASSNLESIVDRVRPSLEPLMENGVGDDLEGLVARAVRANVEHSVSQILNDSEIVEQLVATQGLLVVGAEYSLETGVVEFFDTPHG